MADIVKLSENNERKPPVAGFNVHPENINREGRPKKEYAFTDTLLDILKEKPELKRALIVKLIELASKGDLQAIKELWDRLEGRAPQPVKEMDKEDWEDFMHIYKPEKNKE